MKPINIYSAEKALARQIIDNRVIAYTQPLIIREKTQKSTESQLERLGKAFNTASLQDEDLHHLLSILVTTSWNLNDDVFSKAETWPARKTPAHKPTNLDHQENVIVGHMTDEIWTINEKNEIIPDDTLVEDLPDVFHIVNGSVLYKCWSDEKLQKQTQLLLEQIQAGEKFVSMECMFTDFDYALISPNGEHVVASRDKDSAWMTKHLRAYGGTGIYDNYKIGRYLKNITFTGKGFVDRPANPESIIFDENTIMKFTSAKTKQGLSEEGGVLILLEHGNFTPAKSGLKNKKENNMAETEFLNKTVENLQADLDVAVKQIKQLETQLNEAGVAELNKRLTESEAQVSDQKVLLEKTEQGSKELTEEVAKLNDQLAEANTAKEVLQKQFAELEIAKIKANRISTLVEGGIAKDTAEEKVAIFDNLTEEQFAVVANEIIAAEQARKPKTLEEGAEGSEESNDQDQNDAEADNAEANADEKVLDDAKENEDTELSAAASATEDEDDESLSILRKDLAIAIGKKLGNVQEAKNNDNKEN